MKRTKPLLSNLLFVSRNEIQLRRRTSEKFVQVLVVKPQFDAGWPLYAFNLHTTLRRTNPPIPALSLFK